MQPESTQPSCETSSAATSCRGGVSCRIRLATVPIPAHVCASLCVLSVNDSFAGGAVQRCGLELCIVVVVDSMPMSRGK